MKAKVPIVLLILVSLGLGVALYLCYNRGMAEKQEADAALQQLREQHQTAESALASERQQLSRVQGELQAKAKELEKAGGALVEVQSSLNQAQAESKATQDQLAAAQAEAEKRSARIKELEDANHLLDQEAQELRTAIADREGRIADTERRLAASDGDRTFLLTELKRLQREKDQLERQFSDLVVIKEQFRKLKEDLATQKRIEWSRRGVLNANVKGAELLHRGVPRVDRPSASNTDLNVEIREDGSATILPAGEGQR